MREVTRSTCVSYDLDIPLATGRIGFNIKHPQITVQFCALLINCTNAVAFIRNLHC